ncbi:MAG: MerR family transcriptional regulator [Victivallales bacterium]
MKTLTIGRLAKEFGLSRSTLLYYDSIGLLCPDERNESGYRIYSERDRARLKEICLYRNTGMPLEEISKLLSRKAGEKDIHELLKKRLKAINGEIVRFKQQQNAIVSFLSTGSGLQKAITDKHIFVQILEKTGLDEAARKRLHQEFEKNAPDAHHGFLAFLGFSPGEIRKIRERSSRKT